MYSVGTNKQTNKNKNKTANKDPNKQTTELSASSILLQKSGPAFDLLCTLDWLATKEIYDIRGTCR